MGTPHPRGRLGLEAIEHRRQQLMQPGERELHLRLDTRGTRHTEARRVFDQVVQQHRLAHARLAAHHQRQALTRANSFGQPVEDVALAAAVRQLRRATTDGGMCGHLPASDVTRVATGCDDQPPADANVPAAARMSSWPR